MTDDASSIDIDMNQTMSVLSKEVIKSRLAQDDMLRQSVANGGPSSAHDAIINLMDQLDIGIRQLSRETDVARSRLAKMIQGEIPMPPEVITKIRDVFKRKNPTLFGVGSSEVTKHRKL